MNNTSALLISFLAGCFFIVGPLINKIFKDGKKLVDFVMGMAISITVLLIFCDLLPECLEMLEDFTLSWSYLIIFASIALGMLVLKILDSIIPHHYHEHEDNEKNHHEHHSHIEHIGLLTSMPIIIHNILEGIIIYNTALIDTKAGIIFALSIGMHNIPLSMQIGASLKNNKKKLLIFALLILSTPIGAGLMYFIFSSINEVVFGILLSFTIGMLLYIIVFELVREVLYNSNKKYAFLGIIFGIIFMGIHMLGHEHH